MPQYAMRMRIREGREEEYARVHAALWPDLRDAFDAAGYRDYVIFVDGRDVFQVIEYEGDIDDLFRFMAKQEPAQRWYREYGGLLEDDFDGRGRQVRLTQVFR